MSKIMSNTEKTPASIQAVELGELSEKNKKNKPLLEGNIDVIKNVQVKVDALMGSAEITVDDLYQLKENSVIKLDRAVDASIDITLDGRVIARGNIVVADDNFGICITEIHG